jgi:hypothetical protein
MNAYLSLLEKSHTIPNFFISEEYRKKSGIIEKQDSEYVYWYMGGWVITPPINKITGETLHIFNPLFTSVWSDFPDWIMPGLTTSKFLDYEFIFDPKSFLKMEGGEWQTFRKNCKKFPRRFQKGLLSYDSIDKLYCLKGVKCIEERLKQVMIDWLDSMGPNTEIQDDDVMIKYLLHGKNRKILHDSKGYIYGVNIWDENWKYINYRFCICKKEDFLSEYMRYLFYTDSIIQAKNKLVNDGGSVGNIGLEKFKRKMNPIVVREVKSWFKME